VLGVAACSMLACKVLNFTPPFSYILLLPLTVWILYLSDHIADGQRHANKIPATRYQLYYTNARLLLALIIVLILTSLAILFFTFDRITFQFGILVGILVLVYFIFQQLRFKGEIFAFPKEPVIAIIYSLGIWGEPLFMFKEGFSLNLYLALISFAFMVLMNVQIYSVLQVKEDKESGYPSIAVEFGDRFVNKLNLILGIFVAIISLCLILLPKNIEMRNAGIIFLAMDTSLLILNGLSRFLKFKEIVGMLADAVFFIPFSILLFRG
jgi:hypothetical protein